MTDEPVICLGCGSNWNNMRLFAERENNPHLISCCPERESVTLKQAYEIINKLRAEREAK